MEASSKFETLVNKRKQITAPISHISSIAFTRTNDYVWKRFNDTPGILIVSSIILGMFFSKKVKIKHKHSLHKYFFGWIHIYKHRFILQVANINSHDLSSVEKIIVSSIKSIEKLNQFPKYHIKHQLKLIFDEILGKGKSFDSAPFEITKRIASINNTCTLKEKTVKDLAEYSKNENLKPFDLFQSAKLFMESFYKHRQNEINESRSFEHFISKLEGYIESEMSTRTIDKNPD